MGTADLPDGVSSGDTGHVQWHEDLHDFLAGRAAATADLDLGTRKVTGDGTVPPGGSSANVLTKQSGTDYDVAWSPPAGGLTVGGTPQVGYVPKATTGTGDGSPTWQADDTGSGSIPTPTDSRQTIAPNNGLTGWQIVETGQDSLVRCKTPADGGLTAAAGANGTEERPFSVVAEAITNLEAAGAPNSYYKGRIKLGVGDFFETFANVGGYTDYTVAPPSGTWPNYSTYADGAILPVAAGLGVTGEGIVSGAYEGRPAWQHGSRLMFANDPANADCVMFGPPHNGNNAATDGGNDGWHHGVTFRDFHINIDATPRALYKTGGWLLYRPGMWFDMFRTGASGRKPAIKTWGFIETFWMYAMGGTGTSNAFPADDACFLDAELAHGGGNYAFGLWGAQLDSYGSAYFQLKAPTQAPTARSVFVVQAITFESTPKCGIKTDFGVSPSYPRLGPQLALRDTTFFTIDNANLEALIWETGASNLVSRASITNTMLHTDTVRAYKNVTRGVSSDAHGNVGQLAVIDGSPSAAASDVSVIEFAGGRMKQTNSAHADYGSEAALAALAAISTDLQTIHANLAGGTTGQQVTKDTATAYDFSWGVA